MDIHKTCPHDAVRRQRMVNMVLSGPGPKAVGEVVGDCPRTVHKWAKRIQTEGVAGLQFAAQSPAPADATGYRRPYRPLRRQRLIEAIAAETAVPPATASRVLKR